ncbi:polyamine ABC transporter substrate-binding protein [Limnochorda pilosa]|uniref:Polyamine ABC transporter substrate-binding protein n=1 Tax=Limnochorda pilosa TaxID=1555112 RepID=A0A0K2SLD3_LIMPI|nr:spermidine/putrescine ABC transporter substrate-binding protein [Limnochorda pilosa]BAS27928.1 polyamine ABC transporter substrate-binding protein [Limnochorda pilosa]
MRLIRVLFTLVCILLLTVPTVGRAASDELRLYIWSEYIDPAIIESFERETGIKVLIDLYESNEDMLAKLQAGGVSQYDVVVPSDFIVPILIKLGLLQPLDHSKIPNLENLDPQFLNPPFDRANRYTAAYQWGTVGLMYRRDLITSFKGTWSILFDSKQQVGPFVLIDSQREMMAIALKYLGYSANTTDPAQIKAAGELLLQAKKSRYALGFEGGVGGKNKVLAGVATAAVVYNGDAIRATEEDPNVAFVVPDEGSVIWVDSLAVPARAPNPAAAHKFINFILDPRIGAQLSNFNRYATPNAASLPMINPEDRSNSAIYPSPEVMKKLEYILDLGKDLRLYDEVWTMVKSR